ncbi:hypothetical protein [Nesterenkonia ebinurensis]|uniref:hypothetical protein n=1 Tax=Nesterenkonia ebinurensis TaxID=2608252 RepID=UPI00123D3FA0|nr:hypothetical protein [Nesterenkonia ebinurensis]
MLILRKQDDAAVEDLEQQWRVAELYGTETSTAVLTPGTQRMLQALRFGGSAVRSAAEEVQAEARSGNLIN